MRDHVAIGATVYTDAALAYSPLFTYGFEHQIIEHAVKYVEGRVHTNHLENFWSCLKRTLQGTYIAATPFHLDAYVNEQVWRFNERHNNGGGRFASALKAAEGRRLTYRWFTSQAPS